MVKRLQNAFVPLSRNIHVYRIWIYQWARGVKTLMWLSKDFISPSWTKLSSRKKDYCWNRIAGNRQCGFPLKPVPWWFLGKLLFIDSWTGWLSVSRCSQIGCDAIQWRGNKANIELRRVMFIVFFPQRNASVWSHLWFCNGTRHRNQTLFAVSWCILIFGWTKYVSPGECAHVFHMCC